VCHAPATTNDGFEIIERPLRDVVGAERAPVVGSVDPRNLASKAMLVRAAFALRGPTPNGLEEWVLEVRS
jgi:hypothetical protein